ncbi:hypothetical protein F2Q70_00038784 [Brassica cretica]|uniref:Uncharacterized protein n=1 Tax=Brassica cretica TaxID=69181 RepID=A0A8S9K6C3_BRACR|nr:hypothetical protein F2Q70_00038784 [Brassica cretica]
MSSSASSLGDREQWESVMKRFEFQETRLEKMEEEAMRTKMSEEMIESYDRIWFMCLVSKMVMFFMWICDVKFRT